MSPFGINKFFQVLHNLFQYHTFRVGFAFFMAMIINLIAIPYFITFMKKVFSSGQPIREDGPQIHSDKKGTPTMGGAMIFISAVVSTIFISGISNFYLNIALLAFFGFSLIGFLDDLFKLMKKSIQLPFLKSKQVGMAGKLKMFLQISVSFLTIFALNNFESNEYYDACLTFPILKNLAINLGILYTIIRIFTIVGTSNAVNLTDGLDGLVTIPLIFNYVFFAAVVYVAGSLKFASYFYFYYQEGIAEVAVLCGAVVGAALGFLWYNIKPAKIFMGDVGSLGLGGLLGTLAVMTKNEIVLIITGALFVIEALSVMLQVYYFKFTGGKNRGGKRIFRMAPLHHHFELGDWSEMQVVIRFWIISAFCVGIGFLMFKIR